MGNVMEVVSFAASAVYMCGATVAVQCRRMLLVCRDTVSTARCFMAFTGSMGFARAIACLAFVSLAHALG